MKHSEHNCRCGLTIFKILTALCLLDIVFVTATSFVYLKDYFGYVRRTYNNENRSYIIRKEFVLLYVCSSFSTAIFILYVLFILIWLLINHYN